MFHAITMCQKFVFIIVVCSQVESFALIDRKQTPLRRSRSSMPSELYHSSNNTITVVISRIIFLHKFVYKSDNQRIVFACVARHVRGGTALWWAGLSLVRHRLGKWGWYVLSTSVSLTNGSKGASVKYNPTYNHVPIGLRVGWTKCNWLDRWCPKFA